MPVIPSGPSYRWIGRVDNLKTELCRLSAGANIAILVRKWRDEEFILSLLRLEGTERPEGLSNKGVTCARINAALNTVEELAGAEGGHAPLTTALLLKLHGMLGSGPSGVTTDADAGADADREPATGLGAIEPIIDAACHWWTAESFLELHPVEQAAIVHLRLMDMNPFKELTQRVSVLASSNFLLRAGLPPLIVPAAMVPPYRNALAEARRTNTQPTVELFAESTERTLTELIRLAREK